MNPNIAQGIKVNPQGTVTTPYQTPTSTPTTTTPTQSHSGSLDQDVVALAKSIRRVEGGEDPAVISGQRLGAKGEKGAYQWMPGNYEKMAQKYGVDPKDFSLQAQNKVAYSQLKEWKDEGLSPGQIAARWNGAKYENDKYVPINPQYTTKVAQAYQQFKTNYNTTPILPPVQEGQVSESESQEQTLGQDMQKRLGQASHGLELVGQGGVGNIAMGAIQTVGAGAGAIGDVATKAIELIPGVKMVEKLLGKGIGAIANTELGQSVIGELQRFAENNPELAKTIGAAGNILTVIPIFKGLSLAKQGASKAIAKGMEGKLTKAVTKELDSAVRRTIKGGQTLDIAKKRGIDPIHTLVKTRALPDIIEDANGVSRYASQNAFRELGESIAKDDDILTKMIIQASAPEARGALQQGLLSTAKFGQAPTKLELLRKEALRDVSKEFAERAQTKSAQKAINAIFDDYKASYGEYVDLITLNNLKRGIREGVNFASDKLDSDVRFHLGQLFMKKVEEVGAKQGIKGIRAINRQMGAKLEAQKILKLINNKSVQPAPGLVRFIREQGLDVPTIAGEALGQTAGIPGVGAIMGRNVGRYLGRNKPATSIPSLRKTDPGSKLRKTRAATYSPLVPLLLGAQKEQQQK